MTMLALVFTISLIVAGGFLAWTYTKSGKERRERLHCFSLLSHINRCSKTLLPPASSASSGAVHRSDSR